MKIQGIISITMMVFAMISTVSAAQRTVMYEHFTEDLCSYCPEVAAAIEQFRANHDRTQVAIISYSVRGTDPCPGGEDRMGYYSKEFCPAVIGDGSTDFEPLMPINVSDLENHYNTRKDVSAPLSMEVIKLSNTSYKIIMSTEQAVGGDLMAVAYEDIYHDSVHYPHFARQVLTDIYGDPISLASGEVREIIKTVTIQSGWNPDAMGVVAWIQETSKSGGRAFRAHPVYQSADSKAPHSEPTPTPTPPEIPTCTPPPTQGTPTPTPTFSETDLQQDLILNLTTFHPGDPFELKVNTRNPAPGSTTVDQYIALQVIDSFYFWPNWTTDLAFAQRTYATGCNQDEIILSFTWPSGTGSFSGLYFWLVSLCSGTTDLAGPYDSVMFGYED